MKYIKIAAIGLMFAAVLSSCETDNTTEKPLQPGTGIVNFGKSEITVKENVGLFSIPLDLTGEPGGYPVTVRVKAEVVSGADRVDEVAYITTQTIKITESNNSFVQIRARYIPEVNADSQIKITIDSVNGAKVGTSSTCLVSIENIYAIKYGVYTFSCPNSSKAPEWSLILRAGADGTYIMENLFDLSFSPKLVGNFDETTRTLTFGGQLNGKGSDNYFVLRTFGSIVEVDQYGNQITKELFLYGGGAIGFDPIVFKVSDKWELTTTDSAFRIQTQEAVPNADTKVTVLGDATGKSTLTYLGAAEEDKWPFN